MTKKTDAEGRRIKMLYVGIENDSITLTVTIPDSDRGVVCEMTPEAALELSEKLKVKVDEFQKREGK
jgi:hypothetical protein